MARVERMRSLIVESIPEVLEDGVLYVSPECRVALHRCCCGCGEEVSTPLGGTEYSIRIDQGRATLRPSIGNHDFACASHYFIEQGEVVWAAPMSREEIEAGRAYDRYLKRGREPGSVGAALAWLKRLWSSFGRRWWS